MAAPLVLSPLALAALRYAAVATLAWYAARRPSAATPVAERDAMDEFAEGVELRRETDARGRAWRAAGRFRRTIRVGRAGLGVEIDLGFLARLRLRPLRGAL